MPLKNNGEFLIEELVKRIKVLEEQNRAYEEGIRDYAEAFYHSKVTPNEISLEEFVEQAIMDYKIAEYEPYTLKFPA